MKKTLIIISIFFIVSLNNIYSQCVNGDFSSGNFTNWVGSTGENNGGNYTSYTPLTSMMIGTPNSLPYLIGPFFQTIMNIPGTDTNTDNLLNVLPPIGSSSCRIGSGMVKDCDGSSYPQAARLEYTITVDSSNSLFTYQYAVVLQSLYHTTGEQSKFIIRVLNATGVTLDSNNITAITHLNGFNTCLPASASCAEDSTIWKDWTTVVLNLSPYLDQNITIEFTSYGCTPGNHFGYAYISCYCSVLTGIKEIEGINNENNIVVYPNPATNKITIDISKAAVGSRQEAVMEILNIQGQIIIQQALQQGKTTIDISALAKGVYIVKLCGKDKTGVSKIVKE